MQRQYLEPVSVTEVRGGRFDGMKRVTGVCPNCKGTASHLLSYDSYGGGRGDHRVCDTNRDCRNGGYYVVRPMRGLLGDFPWWKPAPTDGIGLGGFGLGFGFGLSGGNGLSLLGGV